MEINKDNYRDWLIRYLEDDLNSSDRADVEQFMNENQEAAREWEFLKKTRLSPDPEIRFPNKSLLFRTEEPVVELKKPVIVYRLYRYAAFAAAAAMLVFVIIFTLHKPENRIETAAAINHNKNVETGDFPTKNQPVASLKEENKTVPVKKSQRNTTRVTIESKLMPKTQIANQTAIPKSKEQPAQNIEPEPVHKINEPVALQKKPEPENADQGKITHQSVMKEQLAIAKEPVNHAVPKNPAKTTSLHEDNDETLLQSALSLFHHISIKKQEKDQQTYYALSIQTSNISINKTIK